MALVRRLGLFAVVSSCWFVAAACGDDSGKKVAVGDAGAGGVSEAGNGGEREGEDKSGSGGSTNNAGKGGAAAGTAGQTNGGTAGGVSEAGNGGGGDAPLGGAAGAGGTGSGGGGEGGASGGAGGAGGTPVAEAKACSWSCAIDADCTIQAGVDRPANTDFKCNQETKRCENPSETCAADADCVKKQWLFECDGVEPCPLDGDICISWQGRGYCATPPELQANCVFGGEPEALPLYGQDGTAQVCVDRAWICDDANACALGCADDAECSGKGGRCNVTTHRCECDDGSKCASGACGEDGQCVQCATDEHCAASATFPGHDICVAGKCGCSGPDSCYEYNFVRASTVCQ